MKLRIFVFILFIISLIQTDEYDTYIIIYFKEDINYPSGFKND